MPHQPRPPHVVVIGGGMAGLSAAQALLSARPGLTVTVLEASPQIGGKLRLGTVAGQPVDLGAESLLNRRPEALALAGAVGLAPDREYPATTSARLWSRGRLHPLPPSVFGVPVGTALSVRSWRAQVLSHRGVLRARAERLLPAPRIPGDVAVGALVSERLGREVRDRLVEPMLGGVYAGRADELSFAATLPQLHGALASGGGLLQAAERVRASSQGQSGAPPPVFVGIQGGVGRLAVAVADDVVRRGGSVRRSATVRAVEQDADAWRVVVGPTIRPEEVRADAVVVAVPAAPASRLLHDVSPTAAGQLAGIEYASMAIVTLAFPAADVTELSGSGFLVPPVERRTVKAATFSSRKWGWMDSDLVVVRCSIGRHREESELQREDGELVSAALRDLRAATGVRAPVVDAVVARWGGGLPQYAVGHLDTVARIQSAVAEVPGLEICGAMLDGVGVPAVIKTGQQAANRVLRHLDARETMKA